VAARFFNATETHLFSPTLVNELRFGFVHINDQLNNVDPVTTSDIGIIRPTTSVTKSIYKFVFASSGFEIGPAPFGNQHQAQNNYNFVDTVSWVKGAHLFRFGGEFTRVNLDKLFPQVFNGELFSRTPRRTDRSQLRQLTFRISCWGHRSSVLGAEVCITTNIAPTITGFSRRTIGRSGTI